MGNTRQVPAWVSYLQALAVPLIALIGAWIAAAHGGRLELTRSDNQGSVFTATLPKSPISS